MYKDVTIIFIAAFPPFLLCCCFCCPLSQKGRRERRKNMRSQRTGRSLSLNSKSSSGRLCALNVHPPDDADGIKAGQTPTFDLAQFPRERPSVCRHQTSSFQLRVPKLRSKVAFIFGASNVMSAGRHWMHRRAKMHNF